MSRPIHSQDAPAAASLRPGTKVRRLKPIRIALGIMPRLLRDIVVDIIRREPDLQLIGEASDDEDLRELLRSSHVDILVSASAPLASPAGRDRLLREHESIRLLVLLAHGKTAELHWLEPRTTRCLDVSTERLVRMIRTPFSGSATP